MARLVKRTPQEPTRYVMDWAKQEVKAAASGTANHQRFIFSPAPLALAAD